MVMGLTVFFGLLSAEELTWKDIGRGNLKIQSVWVMPKNERLVFAGSAGNIFKSEDSGDSWRRVLRITGANRNVNCFTNNPQKNEVIYAATGNGLYRSNDTGERWERIFRGRSKDEAECISLVVSSDAIFLGTRAGFFISRNNGRSWDKQDGLIGSVPILSLEFDPREGNYIYLVSINKVLRSADSGKNWEEIFLQHAPKGDSRQAEDSESQQAPLSCSELRFIKTEFRNTNILYLATAKGVYKSVNRGQNWEKLSDSGLLNRDVLMLCISESSEVFALTSSRIFVYRQEGWQEISSGLDLGEIRYLALNSAGILYAAGEKGIYKTTGFVSSGASQRGVMQEYFRSEPKINDLYQAAIRYAEVSPEKIARWRQRAGVRAILPQLSVGVDRNSTDLWHWETGSTTKIDDVLRRGKDNLDWDVSLSWDFGDLIWNEDQVNIDVRSKLMVELRDDILDQVNKLYFERIRVKMEMDSLNIIDRKKRLEKELKLEELAASLDALTSGYYSEQLHLLAAQ